MADYRAREMDQPATCYSTSMRIWVQIHTTHIKINGACLESQNCVGRDMRISGTWTPVSLVKLVNSRFSDRLYLKKLSGQWLKMTTEVECWSPHACTHMNMYPCSNMYKYDYIYIQHTSYTQISHLKYM